MSNFYFAEQIIWAGLHIVPAFQPIKDSGLNFRKFPCEWDIIFRFSGSYWYFRNLQTRGQPCLRYTQIFEIFGPFDFAPVIYAIFGIRWFLLGKFNSFRIL